MRGRRENRRTYGIGHNRSGFKDLRPQSHFAEGGDVQQTDAELQSVYDNFDKIAKQYPDIYSPEYMQAIRDEIGNQYKDKYNSNFGLIADSLSHGYMPQGMEELAINKDAGGARAHKNAQGKSYEDVFGGINQNYLNSEDEKVKNDAGVKYLKELYDKAKDPNASWNDVMNAKLASDMLDQGYTYKKDRGLDSWKKDEVDIVDAIGKVPIVGKIAKAMGLDRMVGNMEQIMKSENIGEGLENTLNFATDAAGTLGSAIGNPGQFAASAAANLITDQLAPKQVAEEEPGGYEQYYGEYDASPHVQSMMNPSARPRQYIGQANQPYLQQQQQAESRLSGGDAGENYGYMSASQRAAQHKAYSAEHPDTPGSPAPQASPPPPATGTTAPPAISNQSNAQAAPQTLKGGGTVGHSFYKELHSMRRSNGGSTDRWIQKALPPEAKGRLKDNLHIPSGQKIPMKRLMQAEHSSNPTIRKEAQLADRLRHFHHGCR